MADSSAGALRGECRQKRRRSNSSGFGNGTLSISAKEPLAVASFEHGPALAFNPAAPDPATPYGSTSSDYLKASFGSEGDVLTWSGKQLATIWTRSGTMRCQLEGSWQLEDALIAPFPSKRIAGTIGDHLVVWDTGDVARPRDIGTSSPAAPLCSMSRNLASNLLYVKRALAFSSDGRYLAGLDNNGDVQVLAINAGTTSTLRTADKSIKEARFPTDNERLWVASEFQAQLWSLDGSLLSTIGDRSSSLFAPIPNSTNDLIREPIHLSPFGEAVYLRSEVGAGRIWPLTPEVFRQRLRSLTTVCLTESERVTMLLEDRADATTKSRQCEESLPGAK